MELTKQEIKLAKSTAEAYGSLSLGLFALALIIRDAQCQFWLLIALGVASSLISIFIYLALFCRWERNKVVNKILTKVVPAYISHLIWFVGFGALGISLQEKVNTSWGAVCWFSGIVISLSLLYLERRKEMGTKGRKNVKKPKKSKKK